MREKKTCKSVLTVKKSECTVYKLCYYDIQTHRFANCVLLFFLSVFFWEQGPQAPYLFIHSFIHANKSHMCTPSSSYNVHDGLYCSLSHNAVVIMPFKKINIQPRLWFAFTSSCCFPGVSNCWLSDITICLLLPMKCKIWGLFCVVLHSSWFELCPYA